MLRQVKWIGWVVVAIDKPHKTQRFGKLIHASIGAVELDPGNTLSHDVTACAAHKPVNHFTAQLVKLNVLAGAEILQVGEDLSAPRCFWVRIPLL